MSIFRFLSFSLVIAAGVATAAAQSSPEKSPTTESTATAEYDSSVTNLFPSLRAERNSNALDRIRVGDYSPDRSEFSTPRGWLRTNTEPQDGGACLKMRVYKLARDGPNSDSMHPAGYSTCVPAARFKACSIVLTTP
jgi:hypothetical protein